MKLFRCDHCGHIVYFENVRCEVCGHRLGYWHETSDLLSLDGDGEPLTSPVLPEATFIFCANAQYGACNWLVAYEPGATALCRACRHNEVIPPLADTDGMLRWQALERAKKRLIYSLLGLRLPLATRAEDPQHGLGFRFLDEAAAPSPVLTGHQSGTITIALTEADDAAREYRRTQFNEPYRTLLGHFRHEIGHHYWDLLVAGTPHLPEFRRLFGDETADYQAALQRYYAEGAPFDWQKSYVSAYATAHPWEDFAETWAHYLHLVDTIEMAASFGLSLTPEIDCDGPFAVTVTRDPYRSGSIAELMRQWIPLVSLINSLNRSMGQHDAYPFVLGATVIGKMEFIHALVRAAADQHSGRFTDSPASEVSL